MIVIDYEWHLAHHEHITRYFTPGSLMAGNGTIDAFKRIKEIDNCMHVCDLMRTNIERSPVLVVALFPRPDGSNHYAFVITVNEVAWI